MSNAPAFGELSSAYESYKAVPTISPRTRTPSLLTRPRPPTHAPTPAPSHRFTKSPTPAPIPLPHEIPLPTYAPTPAAALITLLEFTVLSLLDAPWSNKNMPQGELAEPLWTELRVGVAERLETSTDQIAFVGFAPRFDARAAQTMKLKLPSAAAADEHVLRLIARLQVICESPRY